MWYIVLVVFTELENQDWKGDGTLWSNCSAQSGFDKECYWGLCPVWFRVPPRLVILQHLWAVCSAVSPPSQCVKKWKFPCLILCPLPLVRSWGITEEILAFSANPPVRHLYTLTRSPLRPLFSGLSSPSALSFFPYVRWPKPLILFMVVCWTCSSASMSCFYWGPQKWTQNSRYDLTSSDGGNE